MGSLLNLHLKSSSWQTQSAQKQLELSGKSLQDISSGTLQIALSNAWRRALLQHVQQQLESSSALEPRQILSRTEMQVQL